MTRERKDSRCPIWETMACEAELLDEISSEEIDVEAETKASALRLLGGRLRTGSVAFSFFGETSFRGFRRKRRGMQIITRNLKRRGWELGLRLNVLIPTGERSG